MATKKSQRYGIIIILTALVIGTFGSFAAMVLGSENQAKDAANQQVALQKYQDEYNKYQEKVTAQGDSLSTEYYPKFSPYSTRVAAFDRDAVKELQTEDIIVGEGELIGDETKFAAYYIGWNPTGKIFDQSIADNKLKPPFVIEGGLKSAGVIEGWKEGLKGMRIGGVREIVIPSEKAYGEAGQGDDIPPNTALKFVVMAIEAPEAIPMPDYPAELMQGPFGQ